MHFAAGNLNEKQVTMLKFSGVAGEHWFLFGSRLRLGSDFQHTPGFPIKAALSINTE